MADAGAAAPLDALESAWLESSAAGAASDAGAGAASEAPGEPEAKEPVESRAAAADVAGKALRTLTLDRISTRGPS